MAARKAPDMESAISLALSDFSGDEVPEFGHGMRKYFEFDDDWINLNHGSFGACPRGITRVYNHFTSLSERRPDPFIRTQYPALLTASRQALAEHINAPASSIVYVPNATTGVNTVLRGLRFQTGEQILYFSFIYAACGNTVLYVAESTGAAALHVEVTLPISDDDLLALFSSTVQAAGNVKIAVFDTIVSVPGVRLPFERLIRTCKALGVLSMVDGAHAVGHLPLDIAALDPDFLTSNCHKWLYTPRGSAFLYVAERNQALIRSTLPTSWGFVPLPSDGDSTPPPIGGDDAWAKQFTFVGTVNSSSYLCIPAALAFRKRIGGEEKIMAYTCDIARRGAEIFRALFETEIMKNYGNEPLGMFNIRLPLRFEEVPEEKRVRVVSFLTDSMDAHGTYVQIFEYNGAWWSRVSGQIYLEESDFVKGAQVLLGLVAKVRSGEW